MTAASGTTGVSVASTKAVTAASTAAAAGVCQGNYARNYSNAKGRAATEEEGVSAASTVITRVCRRRSIIF